MEALSQLLDTPDNADVAARVRAQIQDDPVAVLRIATAIAENRGQWPADCVTRACREEVALLEQAPGEDVVEEFGLMLLGRDVDHALQWLQRVGVIALLMPELEATVDLVQEGGRRHKDVWEHTKTVVKQAVRRPVVRWAALLHDIGKVPTRTFTRNGVHFHGHAEVGARMFDKMCRRLPFERSMRKKIRFLIKHHLRSAQYEIGWTESAVRRFHREMEAHLEDLLALSRADITSKRPGRRRALLHQISELQARIDAVVEKDAQVPPLPSGLGNAIMEHFGLPPSKRIGDIKKVLEAAVARGELEERRDDDYYLAWIADNDLLAQVPESGR
ncbi:HD domain-containing protein [Haliangium ochraceum]|uniref:Metal dependent phosphohydrolase n=1 Tax=Haliangium ochraceum (strain DSM 14365 / JCM 11303 / SMP-2) TaxID=502025 RepID=D0LUF4_HALO1|nr:HD domain-containing protein [Haliangium ochraceum]ACY19277.1 metal dependent phosphohydrolase [Haliangium ochraceum DSM 14365]